MDGFFGLEIARRALFANQHGMNITAHNIANANTPGYSRQRVVLGTTESYPAPYWNRPLTQGQLGTGVEVESIRRVRDNYFDSQIRRENQSLGYWEVKDNSLKQVESTFNEPSDAGILNIMGEFWNAWQQLSKNPESLSTRSTTLEMARMLTTSFNQVDGKLTRLQDNLNEQVALKVDEINSVAQKISTLNQDILKVKAYGSEPNDLMDQRDLLIDQLSKLVDVQVRELETGVSLISINGMLLVGDNSANLMKVQSSSGTYYDVLWEISGLKVDLSGGELKGLIDARDTTVQGYRTSLDNVASALITNVNNLHQLGYGLDGTTTGKNFFTGTKASDIDVHSDVSDPKNVAASLSGAPGDNSNALAIAQLKDALVVNGTSTIDSTYRSVIANLGVESQESERMVSNGKIYYDLIENHRQSVSGVSLDEEASNMIKYQRAYEAAARITSVFDDMLDVLINRMGR